MGLKEEQSANFYLFFNEDANFIRDSEKLDGLVLLAS
jgi:hypothetical protein